MARNNRYSQNRNSRNRVAQTEEFAPIPNLSGIDRVVADDDPEVAEDLAEKTAELEAAAAEAVSAMRTSEEAEEAAEETADEVAAEDEGVSLDHTFGRQGSEPEPEPEPQPKPRSKQASEATATPMTGIVTELPPLPFDDELVAYAEAKAEVGEVLSVEDYVASIMAHEKFRVAEIMRYRAAQVLKAKEEAEAKAEAERQAREAYLAERELVLVAKVKGVDVRYGQALKDYREQGWGNQLPDGIVRAIYEHPTSGEVWEIEDPQEQRAAKQRAFAELAQKKGQKKARKKGRKARKSQRAEEGSAA